MTVLDPPLDSRTAQLRADLGERVMLPGEPGYDRACMPWNLAAQLRPAAVACPKSAEEVVELVRAATAAGLRVAALSTGHAADALSRGDLCDVLLVNLCSLRGVSVDPLARTARVLGGATWNDVLAATAPHGLTALHGSAGTVSVAGYILAGGVSMYSRAHGLAVGSVREVQVVVSDGSLLRASAEENAELFWALRGGSGNFGIVVSLEIELLELTDVVAGFLLWDAARAAEVTHAWARWCEGSPESVTSTLRVLHLPPLPSLPPFLQGRSVVVVDGAILEDDARAATLLEPLRALAPEVDTFARIPVAAVLAVHMDPPEPSPALSAHAVLEGLPTDAVDAYLAMAADPALFVSELRQLGGAMGRAPEGSGAVGSLDGPFLVHTIAMAPVPEAVEAARCAATAGVAALAPWHAPVGALTFVDGAEDPAPSYGAALGRLRELRRRLDPAGVFVAARPL
ncbi:FAD-binding oxidoreductase [Brachybacterium huguangmaarense]|uniref:FAD-binding oxidoreductase n=1 Tax=Brachybacterium huguangmaarense TaxID=1652028 RepID=A0ABY6FZX9_9MICO|nr:FAD-binding oxidoreductase [Brachybacterium huguangmaarense]UYG16380.1 FAD-binding oxidoreductase [Brachybacterium huguangmaarense]